MNLTDITHSLELVTSSANSLTWAASWTDIDKTGATIATPGSNQGTVTSATTTAICSAPGANVYRIVTGLTLLAAGGAQTATVQKDVGGTNFPLSRATIAVNEALCFEDGQGWYALTAAGERKGLGTPGAAGANGLNGGGTVLGAGTSIVDFGSSGSSHTTLVVTGQAAILAGSLVFPWVKAEATLNHSADEHVASNIRVYASDVVAGVGFTLHAVDSSEVISVNRPARLSRFSGVGVDAGGGRADRLFAEQQRFGGRASQQTGRWSVGWLYTQ